MTSGAGLFITFEGGEGSGKTTQIARLADGLRAKGQKVITTREPGGTPEAEKIRSLLVQRDGGNWTPMAEALLLFAGRTMHVETHIKPALASGHIVISDRFTDSTRAYQCYGHGLPAADVEALNRLALGDFRPDLTFIMDIPVETGLQRAGKRLADQGSAEDRFERLETPFHERLRQGYLAIARQDPQRCRVVDAASGIDDIAGKIAAAVEQRLKQV